MPAHRPTSHPSSILPSLEVRKTLLVQKGFLHCFLGGGGTGSWLPGLILTWNRWVAGASPERQARSYWHTSLLEVCSQAQ